jgi:hypothetical protein
MSLKNLTCALAAMVSLVLFSSVRANAEDIDTARMLSVGAGFASPSKTSALVENPAGLALNERTRILGVLGSDNDSFNPLNFGGGAFFGNGQVGAGAEIQRLDSAVTQLDLGIAADIPSVDLALGVHLGHPLDGGSGWTTDIGAIFNERGRVRTDRR